jgi:hypothetical protein
MEYKFKIYLTNMLIHRRKIGSVYIDKALLFLPNFSVIKGYIKVVKADKANLR